MKTLNVMLSDLNGKILPLGYEGENLYTRVRINCIQVFSEYPDAVVSMVVRPPVGDMYPAAVEKSGVMVVWDITDSVLSSSGQGQVQLTFTDDEIIRKSVIFGISINSSLVANGEAPEPVQEWIDSANETAHQIAHDAAMEAAEEVIESIPEDYTEMSNDVRNLKSTSAKKAPAIYEEIESVPLATFADGAEDMPLKNLKVAIEPVQDLHGYDHPWPAGGGKNIIPLTLEKIKANNTIGTWNNNDYVNAGITYSVLTDSDGNVTGVNVNGTASGNSSLFLTKPNEETIPVSSGAYVLSGCPASGSTTKYYLQCYGTNEYTAGSGILDTGSKASASFTADDSIKNVLFQVRSGNTVSNLKLYPMFCKASESADFAPYSNICPISGWTGAKVTRTGKNWVDPAKYEWQTRTFNGITYTVLSDGSIRAVGTSTAAGGPVFTSRFQLPAGTYYGNDSSTENRMHVLYRYAMQETDGTTYPATNPFVSDGTQWFYINLYCDSANATVDTVLYPQIELGSTATTYEPYQGNTYDITFPSEAGTVYGGTLDVLTGELVVDRIDVHVTSAREKLSQFSTDAVSIFPLNGTSTSEGVRALDRDEVKTTFISNLFASRSIWKSVLGSEKLIGISASKTSGICYLTVPVSIATTREEMNAWLANNEMHVVCNLITPITYQLTHQQVRTLIGTNNIWADAGDVSLLYPADTKAYIDNQIASTRKLIAGIETEFKASKAYSVGDMLIIGNDLYKVSASIASGATITVGTNVTKTTVAEQLIALANA